MAVQSRLERGLDDIICVNCESRIPLFDLIERKFDSSFLQKRARLLELEARSKIDNESRELMAVGHAFAVSGEAGQIYRGYTNSDHGIDGEIEFKSYDGRASGRRVYLQLKSGDSYLRVRKSDGAEVFSIQKPRHAEYWQNQAYPVMLVVRTEDGRVRWMDVSDYLRNESSRTKQPVRQIVFQGEPFTALNLQRIRDRVLAD
jgi:hypothetical protein